MDTSPSLVIGRSYLKRSGYKSVTSFITRTASQIKLNPDTAAEITLAATDHLLSNLDELAPLRSALSKLVDASCKARDESMSP